MFRDCQVQRLASFFLTMRDVLQDLAPAARGMPRIVLLSPGPTSPTYFEDAYLARYLGYALVEGGDLTVRDNQVFLKTLGGLLQGRCDPPPPPRRGLRSAGAARRFAARRLRPDARRPQRPGGARQRPGLQPARIARRDSVPADAGPVLPSRGPAAAVGADLVVRRRRGPAVRARTTWSSSSSSPAFRGRNAGPIYGARLTRSSSARSCGRGFASQPQDYVAQELVAGSTAPMWNGGAAAADARRGPHVRVRRRRPLRSDARRAGPRFALARRARRIGPRRAGQQRRLGAQRGPGRRGHAAASGRRSGRLAAQRPRPAQPRRRPPVLARPPRRADRRGRPPRAEHHLAADERNRLQQPAEPGGALAGPGRAGPRAAGVRRARRRPADCRSSRASCWRASSIPRATAAWRGCWPTCSGRRPSSATASRSTVGGFSTAWASDLAPPSSPDAEVALADVLSALNHLILDLSAFSGMGTESMTRGPGWRFLDMGRRIERGQHGLAVLRSTLVEPEADEDPVFEALLEIADSSMTYRNRYLTNLQLPPLLGPAADRRDEPAVGRVSGRGAGRSRRCPAPRRDATAAGQRAADRPGAADGPAADRRLFHRHCRTPPVTARTWKRSSTSAATHLRQLSDEVTKHYLIHAGVSRQIGEIRPS